MLVLQYYWYYFIIYFSLCKVMIIIRGEIKCYDLLTLMQLFHLLYLLSFILSGLMLIRLIYKFKWYLYLFQSQFLSKWEPSSLCWLKRHHYCIAAAINKNSFIFQWNSFHSFCFQILFFARRILSNLTHSFFQKFEKSNLQNLIKSAPLTG